MNVTNKTTRTFDILDITEQQARDLLSIAANDGSTKITESEKETLNNLRQALLTAGLTKGEAHAD